MKKISIIVSLMLLFVMVGCGVSNSQNAIKPQPMPNFSAKASNGQVVSSSALKGKVLIIDFWATWCPPCRQEIPGFIALQAKYASRGLQVIGFSTDDNADKHAQFIKDNKLNYPSVLLTQGNNLQIAAGFEKVIGEITGIPTTVVVNKQGQIVYSHVGYASPESFEKIILPLLK